MQKENNCGRCLDVSHPQMLADVLEELAADPMQEMYDNEAKEAIGGPDITTSWHSYPKVYAIGHAYLGALFDGEVVVTEKVDGSQFSFGITV